MSYKSILKFWFEELEPKNWWQKDPQMDLTIKKRFSDVLKQAKNGELSSWRKTAKGALAEIIVLDQFSRNIFRDQAQAFSQDAQALALTQEAIRRGLHREVSTSELPFLIMPIMHSESKEVHRSHLKYFKTPGIEDVYEFEIKHKKIIDRFGRYPHRNEILMRTSTLDELEFLSQPGSSF